MRILSFLCFFIFPFFLFSQKTYFQQRVDFTIAVTLDDQKHTLEGDIAMDYTNNSPETLQEIYLHLWPNAYRDNSSAMAQQFLDKGKTKFYFSKKEDKGYLDKLDFSVNGTKAAWSYYEKNPDIAVLTLPKSLPPGGKVRIASPFFLKIPDSFSRLGHVGESYQLTQWFPKPAVFDHKGWHPMPYLNMGEFYSEFGNFDVSITLPANYVVGATGSLQTATERTFLQKKVAETLEFLTKTDTLPQNNDFPASSSEKKTLRFTAENVHDFAWFADKRFYVLSDTARLSDGKTVDCWAMFTNFEGDLWRKGAFYVKRAIEFYSSKVGNYAWPQATAVQSALSAGGGMEYPMITVIGESGSAKSLDEVITHEVGHNWFYGMLASNERDHPYLDEGLNSYYEKRYMDTYYQQNGVRFLPKRFANLLPEKQSMENLGWTVLQRMGINQAPDTKSDAFLEVEYGLAVYSKTAMLLAWLEKSIGIERMDAAMQAYFQTWKFKHPYPEDFRASLEQQGLDVAWLFEQLETQKSTDYSIKAAKQTANVYDLTLKNKGSSAGPFPITAYRDGQALKTQWFQQLPTDGKVTMELAENADNFVLDSEFVTLDTRRQNNQTKPMPLRVGPMHLLENPQSRAIGTLPWVGYNHYDKLMLGAIFFNPVAPTKRFQYVVMPGYGFGSKNLVGLADFRLRFFPESGFIKRVTVGVTAKSFTQDEGSINNQEFTSRFYRVVPFLKIELPSAKTAFLHRIQYRSLFIGEESPNFNPDFTINGNIWSNRHIQELRYEAEGRAKPHPWSLIVAAESQIGGRTAQWKNAEYLRLTGEFRQNFYYAPKKKVFLRAFAGFFPINSEKNHNGIFDPSQGSMSLLSKGLNDYRNDGIFLGRNEGSGIFSQQVQESEGGFKNALYFLLPRQLGYSQNGIVALNLQSDLPWRMPWNIPLKPYFDFGYYDVNETNIFSEQFLASGGLSLSFLDRRFEVFFPIVHTKNLSDAYKMNQGNYLNRITWRINMRNWDAVDGVHSLLR